jgi:hypothetical protein
MGSTPSTPRSPEITGNPHSLYGSQSNLLVKWGKKIPLVANGYSTGTQSINTEEQSYHPVGGNTCRSTHLRDERTTGVSQVAELVRRVRVEAHIMLMLVVKYRHDLYRFPKKSESWEYFPSRKRHKKLETFHTGSIPVLTTQKSNTTTWEPSLKIVR